MLYPYLHVKNGQSLIEGSIKNNEDDGEYPAYVVVAKLTIRPNENNLIFTVRGNVIEKIEVHSHAAAEAIIMDLAKKYNEQHDVRELRHPESFGHIHIGTDAREENDIPKYQEHTFNYENT